MMKILDHVCFRLDLYMSQVLLLCIIIFFMRIGYTLLTRDMYKSSLRHIHDLVLSSLKMEGICLLFSAFFLLNAAAAVESETFVVHDARTE
jgi:hypothetical protein